mmetsp:Transcript_112260/g.304722  ORF Transcript_112260/g.304722 Transcript_112260/m.304722 type:complete len:120 (+) Transcript_112260:412-771(+)
MSRNWCCSRSGSPVLLIVADLECSSPVVGAWLAINSGAVPLLLGDLGTSSCDADGDCGGDVDPDVPDRALSNCGGFRDGAAASGCAPLAGGVSRWTCGGVRCDSRSEVAGGFNTNGIFM